MQQLDIEILRYEEKIQNAVSRNLPDAVIKQYYHFLAQKRSEKKMLSETKH